MTKPIFFISISSVIVFIFIMGWFTYLNRTNWTLVAIFLGVVGAIITAYIAPLFILKSSVINEQFPLSIVIDTKSYLPFSFFTESQPMAEMIQRVNFVEEPGKPGIMIPRNDNLPTKENRFDYYAELIQYQILNQCYIALRTKNRISSIVTPRGSDVKNETFEFFRPKEFDEISGKAVAQIIGMNSFFGPQEQRRWGDERISLPVPKNTLLSINGKKELIFRKPKYFKITISVEPQGGMTGIPAQLQDKIKNKNGETLAFSINCSATFDKTTAYNPETEDNKKWARVLFSRLKSEMGEQI